MFIANRFLKMMISFADVSDDRFQYFFLRYLFIRFSFSL